MESLKLRASFSIETLEKKFSSGELYLLSFKFFMQYNDVPETIARDGCKYCRLVFSGDVKGEVHSRMVIYFLYANKKFIQKYVIHQNFSFQRALNPYEIFL